jgi:hypothetical protein
MREEYIQKLKNQTNIMPIDMANARLHLAFLFSSPLIRKYNNIAENVLQLDYSKEIKDILEV